MDPASEEALVINRLSFGATAAVSTQVRTMGAARWVEDQLSKNRPDPAVETLLGNYQLLTATRQQLKTRTAGDMAMTGRELTQATIVRARYSSHQLYEQMCMLWSDHLNCVITSDANWHSLQVDYNENVIRAHAMGKFADLLVASAHSPAMLHYLDNRKSNANSTQGVNENYGRELLELHTLGIEADGSHIYTEEDVKAVALIMSGWTVEASTTNPNYLNFLFRPDYHGTAPVSILGGQWTSPQRVAANGKAAGDDLLQFLARHPSTARYIARKLITRFVTDEPTEALIQSTAAVYLANDTAIVPMLRHIFASAAFKASRGAKLRRPFELLIAAMRATEANVPSDPNTTSAQALRSLLTTMGNAVWGWPTPDGFPDTADPWISSDGVLQRWKLGAELVRNVLTGFNNPPGAVTVDLRALFGNAATLADAADRLAQRFGVVNLTPAQRDQLITIVGRRPTDSAASATNFALESIAGPLLAHTDFQHR